MARFRARAIAADGTVTDEVMEAPDRDAVVERIRATDRLPVDIAMDDAPAPTAAAPVVRRSARPRVAQVPQFTRELQTMLGAGVLLDRALEVQAATDSGLAAVAGDLRRRVRQGEPLSQALAAHPALFDGLYRAMVRAGEAGGELPAALGRLAGYLQRRAAMVAAVRASLTYPAILTAGALLSVIILITVVVPQFESLFREAAAQVPFFTRMIIGLSHLFRDYGWAILLGLVALVLLVRARWRDPALRARIDGALLRMPLIGRLVLLIETERFARTLDALLANRVALPDALALAGEAIGNQVLAQAVREAVVQVRQGASLSAALERSRRFPRFALELIKVGEESGRLPVMLGTLADGYATAAEADLRRAVTLLEPALIVIIGGIVGLIVVSLLSAIVGINALAV